MKFFLGFLPLDVGVSILSAQFIMLGASMFCVNVWSYSSTLISYLTFMGLLILIVTTWVIAFIGCNETSHILMSTAVKLWLLFIVLWLILTTVSLFLTDENDLNTGITCIDSRCTPSCYLINYEIKPEKAAERQLFASNIKTVQDLELYVEKCEDSPNAAYVEENHEINAMQQYEENPSTRFIFHGGHDVNAATSVFSSDENVFANKTESERINDMKQLYNEEEMVNEKFVEEKPNVQPLKYLVINVNRSSWEVIAVPLIFLMIFVFATFVLIGYMCELKNSVQTVT